MVRETRHLWVGNLPDNIREDRIREHFKRYGRVQSIKLLPRNVKEETGENTTACTVAFMDIKSASKAHTAEHKIDERTLTTEYYEPAAIPSAASPQNTNSTYATSPGSTRFTTNSHGTPDELGNFPERFYDRNNSRVAEGEFIRRVNYHDSRGRNRDRNFRNGPYNNVIDRHRPVNTAWSYDATRPYNSETGYGTPPTDTTNERKLSDSQSTKKKSKSQSGSRSVSPCGSNSSRSPTRSRSQSSSSSSSSTTSQASSSTGSPKSRRIAASTNSSHQPVVHSDDRRPLAICVRNLPLRSSDTSLKDGLFHEYKKHGKVTWVKIVGQGSERHAIVCFKKPEDVDKALEVSYDKLFFGCKIEVASYQGYDVDDNELRPYEAEIDEFHPKATRTLFIGNLEKDVTASDLRKHFDQFGEIIEIDIKKQGAVSSYAFCQYSDIISVVKAIRTMDGEHLANNRIKLGFGKSMPTDCVWVDGVVDSVNEKYLTLQFDSFGPITQVIIDRDKGQGLIFYEQVVNAQAAVTKMRGVNMRGRKMQVDFASRECQESFYENLEKQGHPADRTTFDERNPARTFEATTVPATPRFARYETPSTRPRTASYSSRSSVGASQCNTTSTVHSPSTPGSATPRGSGSRSRLARFTEFYDPNTEFTERRYRSYDEYSQGSGASHEEGYEHEYATYNRESPSNVDAADARIPPHNNDHLNIAFAPPDIRNLQKERFHLLEQLEDYTSSGDEVTSSKKRLRLDIIEGPVSSDVIIEANRDHRKVMEVRRTSDGSIKHHPRRPSVDSKHNIRDATGAYLPHTVCKRRKTGGSDSSARLQHHEFSGSESIGSSRPGTPLCDERPENFPTEPRKTPREREGPLSLPLPRFAAQLMGKGSVSVAGIKGQKDNILASPPPAATSPRISNHVAPSLAHVPPPASPPPRPPSLSSNSSDSDATPPSPSLDERIKSLDEKYEKWSGSRAVSAAGSEALAKLDATASERFRFSYKLLDLDLKELQPSEIVKSVLAKPSVFDEDSKRLENVGGKFDFAVLPKAPPTPTATIPAAAPLSAPPVLKTTPTTPALPKTPTMLSPRSSGSNIATAKSLQYPFPSHPPLQALGTPNPATLSPLPTPPASSTPSRSNQIESRPKPSAATTPPSDSKSSSKTVNRIGPTNNTQVKVNDPNNKIGVSIPVNCSDAVQSTNSTSVDASAKLKSVRDKNSDKINRRDSTSSSGSPRIEIKNRRNSENSGRKIDLCDKNKSDNCDTNTNQKKVEEKEKSVDFNERIDSERLEIDRVDKVRLEAEKEERLQKEKERLEREENERKEREEQERVENELRDKEEREKRDREERERHEREEKERLEREEKERRERDERERREREEKERHEREERERREREEKEKRDREDKERREREEKEKRERDEKERRERDEHERLERERKREETLEKRKEEHNRHRDSHSESKHKENLDVNRIEKTKESKSRDNHELFRNNHDGKISHENRDRFNDLKKEEKSKHYDREEKRKENSKENRENNLHEKLANLANEIKENNKPSIESRHFSVDLDRNKSDPNRRKERNNSLPASVGSKRRLSSQDSEVSAEIKRIKMNQEHRKLSERRESKDSKLDDKTKSKHKNNIAKIIEDKMRQEKLNNVKEDERRKDRDRDKDDKHRHKQKMEKQKSKERSKEKESVESKPPSRDLTMDKEFLARLELQSNEDSEKFQRQRKEAKEKRKQEMLENEERNKLGDPKKSEDRKKEKRPSLEIKNRDENSICAKLDERKFLKKEQRIRKMTHSSDAATDSDEPKKQSHSIFDIVDDEPAYISMYDKVKARSCKNMQKQEEEKRQEKIKAKFNQLKQSRAKREEKKRSTSWDEDSDSDRERHEHSSSKSDTGGNKSRRGNKMLIMSSDDDDDEHGMRRKLNKKRDIFSDSDSDKQHIKSEHMETTDDENTKIRLLHRKSLKSRIGSDTSEDEYKKHQKVKDIFSESELDTTFTSVEEKCHKRIKEEDKYIKKEKKNRHQDLTTEELNTQIFGESPLPEIKTEENFDSERMFGDMSSADDNHEMKKQRNELRKKHKKKQKRQKHFLTSEDDLKIDSTTEQSKEDSSERLRNMEKKKQHSKKEKRRDKNKEEHKDKSRKIKKSKSDLNKIDFKRDGKMENIFGSFSDDSETGSKEHDRSDHTKNFLNDFNNVKLDNNCGSDSETVLHIEKEIRKSEEKDRLKEEHKKRKERKRREKEKRIREEEFNENSVDYADLGKQLEANIKDDSNDVTEEASASIKSEGDDRCDDVFRFTEGDEMQEVKVEQDRKESKEKKKKRKKSKEEKHKHHHHHHDKNKVKSPEIKKEIDLPLAENIKEEDKPSAQSPSLPNIIDFPSSPNSELLESQGNSLPKTPTKEKKREKFIPGFGTEIDEIVHETAIKSISEFETIVKTEIIEESKEEDLKPVNLEINEDKPRVVISQEETEDAVAALLGESFGENEYASCYDDEQPTIVSNEQETNVPEVNIVEDLEEMRQAVQSLNSGDLDIKPDTPQSEHDLQIDTDTDEPDDAGVRFDQSPRTPDMIDLSQPPKTPDIPSYYRPEEQNKTVVIKATNLGSPPSLTPIKQPVVEVKKPTEVVAPKPVVSQAWPVIESKPADLPKNDKMPELKIDTSTPISTGIIKSVISPTPKPLSSAVPLLPTTTASLVKIAEHVPLKPISQPIIKREESLQQPPSSLIQATKPHISQPYSVPVHMKYNNSSLPKLPNIVPLQKLPTELPKVATPPNVPFNRLPVTPIIMSKPFQAITTTLPQPKVAQTNNMIRPVENHDQSRVTYPSSQYLLSPQPRMIVQNVQLQRGPMNSQTIVKHIPSVNYRVQQPTYPNPALPIPKEASIDVPKTTSDYSKIVPTLYPYSLPSQINNQVQPVMSDVKQPNVSVPEPNKSFMPVIQETPKLVSLSQPPSIIQSVSKPVVVAYKPQPVIERESEIKKEPINLISEIVPKAEPLPTPEPPKQDLLPVLPVVIKSADEPKSTVIEKVEPAEEKPKIELEDKKEKIELTITETPSVIKKTIDEDKGETESIESDISKERLSADLVSKDDGLDSKEDSDYWSAKEVNIDSVIRKVDALCSADELSDRSSEIGKDDWYDSEMKSSEVPIETPDKPPEKFDENTDVNKDKESESAQEDDHLDEKEINNRGGRRGGRNRGRKGRGGGVIRSGVQTRTAKVKEIATTPAKRGRGGRPKNERKLPKLESDCADVYEFRDDADENNTNKDRPRLILTIKSPVPTSTNGNLPVITPAAATTIIKEVSKEVVSPKPAEIKEEFISPTNTRKSRRLQERDGSKNTIDDTIEDVVRNTPIVTRSASAAVQNQQNQLRRSTRQNAGKAPCESLPKTPRGASKKKDRRGSETTDDSSEEKSTKLEEVIRPPEVESVINVPKESVGEKVNIETPVVTKEKPHQGLKAAVLRRVKGDMNHEPQTLIDPVTGLLMPMRECEEGRYIPIGGLANPNAKLANALNKLHPVQTVANVAALTAPSLNTPNPPIVLQQHKLQSLKAHVLSSQAARVVVSQQQPQPPQKMVTVASPQMKLVTPLPPQQKFATVPPPQQKLAMVAPPQQKLATVPPPQQKLVTVQPPQSKMATVPPPQQKLATVLPSPQKLATVPPPQQKLATVPPPQQKLATIPPPQQKLGTMPLSATPPTLVMKSNIPINQHLNISVSSPNLPPTHLSPKPNLQPSLSKVMQPGMPGMKISPPSPNQIYAHVKQTKPQHMTQPIKQSQTNVIKPHFAMQVGPAIINTQAAHAKQLPTSKGHVIKSHSLHPSSQILTGAVASPPLKPAAVVGPNPRLMQGSASVPSAGAKGSMEPPKVEVSMPNCVMVPHPTSSPQGQPGRLLQTGLPLPGYEANMHGDRSVYNRSRSPPPAHQNSPSPQGEALAHFPPGSVKLRPPHEILPAHYIHPQHVMYQQYLRQSYHLPRSPLIANNIEKSVDGQEGEEAPVELRRPGSVGLALTGRPLAVPHSLQSPHDRSTDSPQVGQVYNIHNSRIPQHYHPGRYFEQADPPPAHRPITSHASYGERALSHMAPLGTPDRPLSNHLPPDRPLSSHLPPDRPLSSHLPPDRPLSNHLPTERPMSNHLPSDRPLSSHAALASTHINSLGAPDRSLPNHLTDRPLPSHGFTLGAGLGAAGNLMGAVARHIGAEAPASQRGLQAATPPHASQVPPQAESLLMLLKQYPCMWQGLLALKNDQAAVQMYFVSGNDQVAKCSLPKNTDGSTPPLRIFQRMRLEPPQVEGVARKMQMENEHCMLLALPCGHDHMDVLQQSTNLKNGFITYLEQKQAAGIVNVAAPGTTQPPAYVVHIFPSCDFVNENLRRIAPNLLERVSDIAHLLIVITTV